MLAMCQAMGVALYAIVPLNSPPASGVALLSLFSRGRIWGLESVKDLGYLKASWLTPGSVLLTLTPSCLLEHIPKKVPCL